MFCDMYLSRYVFVELNVLDPTSDTLSSKISLKFRGLTHLAFSQFWLFKFILYKLIFCPFLLKLWPNGLRHHSYKMRVAIQFQLRR